MKRKNIMIIASISAVLILIVGIFMVFDINLNLFSLKSHQIYASQLSSILNEDYQFVDIRTASEYNSDHIDEFTTNIDFYQFENNLSMLDVLDKDQPVVIICNSGNRSATAYTLMQNYGFKVVINVIDGMQGWYAL
ncbi:MAG: rhodanese-like domain-containing protein [Spirochaetales bacterium]